MTHEEQCFGLTNHTWHGNTWADILHTARQTGYHMLILYLAFNFQLVKDPIEIELAACRQIQQATDNINFKTTSTL